MDKKPHLKKVTKPKYMLVSTADKKGREKLLLELKLELAKKKAALERYKAENKLEFFEPLGHQQTVIEAVYRGKKTIAMIGANRCGKTTTGVAIVGSLCLGKQLWDGRESIFGNKPVRVRIIGSDWAYHVGQVLVPKLKEWLPKGSYETRRNSEGVETFWTFKNGSTIEIMTYKQETELHEGWSGHCVWADELLPKDKYIANKRGLIDYSGIFLITMTALGEPWILDDIVLSGDPSVECITDIDIWSNPYLPKEEIEAFIRLLPEEEKIARVEGKWKILSGRILKEFSIDKHVIEPFELPKDYPVVAMIDCHLNKPQAVGFYSVDKQGRIFVVDEIWDNLSPEEVAVEIKKKKKDKGWNLTRAFIDPLSKGDSSFMRNRYDVEDTFSIIQRSLISEGIVLATASKDKESGIRNIKSNLLGVNKVPTLYFFNTVKRHIYEIQRWVYDENGKPSKEVDDHFMENLYRFTLTGTKYIAPEVFKKPIKYDLTGIV